MSATSKVLIVGLAVLVLIFGIYYWANIEWAEEGTVVVVTDTGAISGVYQPSDGWFTTLSPWKNSYTVNVKSFTEETTARVQTGMDNITFELPISVTAHVDPAQVRDYIRKFGLDEKLRHENRNKLLHGLIQTATRIPYQGGDVDIYKVYQKQADAQKFLEEELKKKFAEELFLTLTSVQMGSPDPLGDDIEAAAVKVAAATKLKDAAEQRRLTEEKEKQIRDLQAQSFSNPAMLELELLKLQRDIEQFRANGIAAHQGPLTVVYEGRGLNLNVGKR